MGVLGHRSARTYSERADIRFSSAEIVVGLGGAGMFNCVFCRPGTKVVDIESTPKFCNAHSNLFASADLSYGIIIGAEDRSDPRSNHRNWWLDLDQALPENSRLLSARQFARPQVVFSIGNSGKSVTSSPPTLDAIGMKYGTDKCSFHHD